MANAERHTADTGRHINNVNHRTTNTEHYCTDTFARAEYGCFSECWASPVVYINMFNVLFQPAKKPDQTPKEKETKSGENQVQFKIIL